MASVFHDIMGAYNLCSYVYSMPLTRCGVITLNTSARSGNWQHNTIKVNAGLCLGRWPRLLTSISLARFEQFIEKVSSTGLSTVNYYNNGITAIGTSAITYAHSTNTNTLAIRNKSANRRKRAPITSTSDYGSSDEGSRGFNISYRGEIH